MIERIPVPQWFRRLFTCFTCRACAAITLFMGASFPGLHAQSLPTATSVEGQIHRGAEGRLIVMPPSPPRSQIPEGEADKPYATPQRSIAGSALYAGGMRRPDACPAQVITCVEVTQTGRVTTTLPVTFGQVFTRGDIPSGSHLAAQDNLGNTLPLQIDQRTSHPDGSLRFAVLSTEIQGVTTGERRQISLTTRQPQKQADKFHEAVGKREMGEIKIDLDVYSPQISVVVFGNREGHAAGIPFQAGENVSITLRGKNIEETYGVSIQGPLVGGAFESLMKIAEAFLAEINGKSRNFKAYKIGEGGGYERLWITTAREHIPFSVTSKYAGAAKIAIHVQQDFESRQRYSAAFSDHPSQLRSTWLSGPVVSEHALLAPLLSAAGTPHPHLSARVHWRRYAQSGATRADVILEGDWAYEPNPRNWMYDVAIRRDGTEIYAHKEVSHTHHGRWHVILWSDGRAEPSVRGQVGYLLRSGAVPHFDESLMISDSVLAEQARALAEAKTGPMGTALLTTYMPMTGGRPDIGPLPKWAVLYILTMDPRAYAALIANADAGAGIPIHYRDRRTDLPVSLDEHPGLAMQYGTPFPRDAFPVVSNGDTPWTPETAHHPSLSLVPYLVTGDLFYLEEVQFWANWVMGSVDPKFRGSARGLLWFNQVRGQAWSLRTLGEAAVFTPDNHPLKRYFSGKLDNNLEWYVKHYVYNSNTDAAPHLGFIETPFNPGQIAPWQQDYLFLVVGHLWEMGVPRAQDFAHWLARFNVGRWNSEANGFCQTMAPAYFINIRRKSDNAVIDNWRDLYRENSDAGGCPPGFPTVSYPDSPGGYVANAYAMLGLASDMDIPGARAALLRIKQSAPRMVARFAEDPTFAIVPRN